MENLLKPFRKSPLWTPGAGTEALSLGLNEIHAILPHREPFLFVERITALDRSQGCLAGSYQVRKDDPVFKGHFPGDPVFPGVLQLEVMGQLGICLAHLIRGTGAPRGVRALKIHHAAFLDVVLPGDELQIIAKVLDSDEFTAICAGQILSNGKIKSIGALEVYFVE